MPPAESVLATRRSRIRVAIEPVQNQLYSMLLLNKTDELLGLDQWATRAAAAIGPARLHTNLLIFEGLFFAVQPNRSWANLDQFIDQLAALPAEKLRDKVLHGSGHCEPWQLPPEEVPDPGMVLASAADYIDHLRRAFPGHDLNIPIEIEAYELLREPARMQELIVDHLRTVWRDVLEAEWARVLPVLEEAVAAFQQLDLSGATMLEAARQVTGQEVSSKWEQLVSEAAQINFVPSAHIGPYLGKFNSPQSLWLIFGARLPKGARTGASAASRSELIVRLGALNDDTRLRILALISQQGELCAPEIMARLSLSQSATSRHLQQLSATGYLNERRRESAKCYSLNRDRIDDTVSALKLFLAAA